MDKARAKYFKLRVKKLVTFTMQSDELKQRMKAVAVADKRSINGWIEKYIIPEIERIVAEQEAQASKKPHPVNDN